MANNQSLSFITKREKLSNRIYKILRERVTHEELAPGEIYSISYIAAQLNVSRTPVHDACQRLEAEGFLTILPKQGILIKPLTINLARESYEMRAAIETYMVRRSFSQITEADIAFLVENCEKQKFYADRYQFPEFMETDIEFHRHLIRKYDNEQANSLLDTLYIRALQIGIMVSKTEGRLIASYNEHLRIVESIKNNDLEQTIKWIETNIMNGYISLTGAYEI